MMQNEHINSPKLRPRLSSSENRNQKTYPHAQSPGAKECHVILPLVIATFIMQSVTFIIFPSQVRTTLNFLLH